MIKSELVLRIAERNPHLYQRDVEILVNAILDTIADALARGDRVELRGFGAFSVKRREARRGRNPRTGAAVAVSEKAIPVFRVRDFELDFASRQVKVGDREIHLTPIEYKLLGALVKNAGRVLTQQQLLKEAWGPRFATQTQYLHVYMGHLRAKLELEPARPKLLLTEPGVGYRLVAE